MRIHARSLSLSFILLVSSVATACVGSGGADDADRESDKAKGCGGDAGAAGDGAVATDSGIFPAEDAATDDGGAADAPASSDAGSSETSVEPTECLSPAGQDSKAWTLTFHDEFDGSALDTSVWNDHVWYSPSDPVINYKVEGGRLKIWPDSGFVNRTLDTDGKYYQTYGFFEAEAKLPYGKGCWPAFWLYNHDTDGQRPEIDIMEAYSGGGPASGWSDSLLHPTQYGATIWEGPEGVMTGSEKTGGVDLSAAFHRYGAKWTDTDVTFYFDGKQFAKFDVNMPNRMYLLLDLWFGSASGKADSTTPTGPGNAYEVNYVRAWKSGGPGC